MLRQKASRLNLLFGRGFYGTRHSDTFSLYNYPRMSVCVSIQQQTKLKKNQCCLKKEKRLTSLDEAQSNHNRVRSRAQMQVGRIRCLIHFTFSSSPSSNTWERKFSSWIDIGTLLLPCSFQRVDCKIPTSTLYLPTYLRVCTYLYSQLASQLFSPHIHDDERMCSKIVVVAADAPFLILRSHLSILYNVISALLINKLIDQPRS